MSGRQQLFVLTHRAASDKKKKKRHEQNKKKQFKILLWSVISQ